MAAIEKFRSYLEAFDGNTTWDSLRLLFEEIMHPDLTVVTADGTLTRDEWEQAIKGLLSKGTKASDIEIKADQDDTIYYQFKFTMSDGTTAQLSSKGTVKDGKLIHVEPVDPEVYSNLTQLASG